MLSENLQEYLLSKNHFKEIKSIKPISGGSINEAYRVSDGKNALFIKSNEAKFLPSFEVEQKGIALLKQNSQFELPEVIEQGVYNDESFILMNFIQKGVKKLSFWTDFAHNLAKMHQCTQIEFGLDYNNCIGTLDQINTYKDDFINFFIECRILPQLDLAAKFGLLVPETIDGIDELCSELYNYIPDENPALLHGDLWSGNFMVNSKGQVALVDPAVYYGHRESEIAFTQLFGGFDPEFYTAYNEVFPMQNGWEERLDIYNIYPLLVHVNIFGPSYANSINNILNKYL